MRRIFALYVISAMGACALFPDLGGLSGDAGVDVDFVADASLDVTATDAALDVKLDAPSDVTIDSRLKNITFENGAIVDAILGVQAFNPPVVLEDAGALSGKFSVGTLQPAADASDLTTDFTQDFAAQNDLWVSMMVRVETPPAQVSRFVKFGSSVTTVEAFAAPDTNTTFLLRYKIRLTASGTTDKTIGDSLPQPIGQTVRIGFHIVQQTTPDAGDGIVQGYVALGTAPFGTAFTTSNQETMLGPNDQIVFGVSTPNFLSATFDNVRIDFGQMPEP